MPFFMGFCLLIGCKDLGDELSNSSFMDPPETAGIYTWWHWMDKAITREGITKDLEAMKDQGIIGATILNIGLFGGKDFGVPQVTFNTPEWYSMFRFALEEANRLGIEIGIHNCDGWSTTGGPWIKPEQSMKQYIWTTTLMEGGQRVSARLSRPKAKMNFYRDVAVIAWPSPAGIINQTDIPDIFVNDSINGHVLNDGEPFSFIELSIDDVVLFSFKQPTLVEKIAIHPYLHFQWGAVDLNSRFDIEISENGKAFQKYISINITEMNKTSLIAIPPVTAKYLRVLPREISGLGNNQSINISEIELLKVNETPRYFPSITSHLEKTVALQSRSMDKMVNVDKVESDANPILLGNVVDLTDSMSADGRLDWNAPAGKWIIARFGYTTTGSENGPATAEGRGLECDKMDTSALNLHFKNFPRKLIDAAGDYAGNTFKYLFIDSWECEYQNWSEDFPSAFEKRRGYDMMPYLPVLCGHVVGSAEITETFLNDFRKTIADLIEENFFKHFSTLCHKHDLELHAEVIYGGTHYPPLDVLRSNKYIDLPMTEFWAASGDPSNTDLSNIDYSPGTRLNAITPTHACAVYGKSLLAAEAYTGFAHYSETPWDLKPYGDMAFSFGVNRMVLHSYVHQPWDKKPGFTLGRYGSHFNRHNNWWQHFSGFSSYLARQQYVLQLGKPVSEICYFIGDRMPDFQARQPLYELPYGYKADHCNPDILINHLVMDEGKIILPDRAAYKMLMLPDDHVMELATLEKLEKLIAEGAIVVGPKPLRCLSLNNYDRDNQKLRSLADNIWGNVDGKTVYENSYGKGKVIWGRPIHEILAGENMDPDIENNCEQPEIFLYYHKVLGDQDIYYLVNQSNELKQVEFLFNVADKSPSVWDPMDGRVHPCMAFKEEESRTRIPLTFRPRQAYFVVFDRVDAGEHFIEIQKSGITIFPSVEGKTGPVFPRLEVNNDGHVEVYSLRGGEYSMVSNKGVKYQVNIPETEIFSVEALSGTIEFVQADTNARTVAINQLRSFTEYDDPFVKYYAGTARYQVRFDLPQGWIEKGYSYAINPGETGASSDIKLNESPLGICWEPGSEINVDGALTEGTNTLEVISTNVWRNRLIGEMNKLIPDSGSWTTSPIAQYLNEDSEIFPAGFSGPVKLLKYKPGLITFEGHEH